MSTTEAHAETFQSAKTSPLSRFRNVAIAISDATAAPLLTVTPPSEDIEKAVAVQEEKKEEDPKKVKIKEKKDDDSGSDGDREDEDDDDDEDDDKGITKVDSARMDLYAQKNVFL